MQIAITSKLKVWMSERGGEEWREGRRERNVRFKV